MSEFIKISQTLFMPTCALMIVYCILFQYIIEIPYYFLIKLLLLISFLFQAICWLISLFITLKIENKERTKKNYVIKILYLKSYQIITQVFCYYLFIYLIFTLDKVSILYNYLVLLLFGLLFGYKIALNAFKYLNDNDN